MISARNAKLAKIHIAKKQLCLDDETYRDLLGMKFNKTSAGKLSDRQLTVLVNHFKAKGVRFTRPKKKSATKDRSQASDPQSRKIRALWIELGNNGTLRNSSERALASYVKRVIKVDDLRFATSYQKSILIEGLKKWLLRTAAAV